MKNSAAGFTLIEVMIALTIVAMTLIAGNNILLGFKANLVRQQQSTLAALCAENELAKFKLTKTFPPEGEETIACNQGPATLNVKIMTSATLNASFRRTNATVYDENNNFILQVSTVFSRY